MRVRARVVAALVGIALVPSMTACSSLTTAVTAQVPTSGPIEQGAQVGVDAESQFIRVIARGPSRQMTPTQIVQGFLEASASFDDDHAVAREYLTPEASATWDTNAGVRIYSSAPEIADLAQTVVMTAAESGEIASNGHLEISPPGQELRESFRLEKIAGEWRISDPPQGLLLSQQDVERAFRSYSVYYFNPDYDILVPDPRMVPVLGSGLATTLVRRLISGPSGWLQPSVRTAFPAGVELNIDSVPIESGTARVDLTAEARQMDDRTRQAVSEQLVWTLRQIPEVQKIEITAAGQPLTVTGHPAIQQRDEWPQADPNRMPLATWGYATRPEGVVVLRDDAVTPVPGGFGTGEVSLVDIAVSADQTRIAGIDAKGSVWQAELTEDSQPLRIREGGSTTAVAFDRSESAWIVDADEGLMAVAADGTVSPIQVTDLSRRSVLLAAVPSRDGTRAALIVRRGPRTVLLLARIVRGVDSASPVTVSAPRRVESELAEVTDVAWSTSDSLSVLGAESLGTLQNYDVDLATGRVVANGTPESPLAVAAAPGLSTLVGATNGLVYGNDSGVWVERARGGDPAYPS